MMDENVAMRKVMKRQSKLIESYKQLNQKKIVKRVGRYKLTYTTRFSNSNKYCCQKRLTPLFFVTLNGSIQVIDRIRKIETLLLSLTVEDQSILDGEVDLDADIF